MENLSIYIYIMLLFKNKIVLFMLHMNVAMNILYYLIIFILYNYIPNLKLLCDIQIY